MLEQNKKLTKEKSQKSAIKKWQRYIPQITLALLMGTSLVSNFEAKKSVDAGADFWSQSGLVATQLDTLAVDPNNSNNLYAISRAVGNGANSTYLFDIYKSTDQANNWSKISQVAGRSNGFINLRNNIAVAPTDSKLLYATTYGGTLQRSTDGGNSWLQVPSVVTTTLPIPTYCAQTLEFSKVDEGVVFMATNLKSTGSGTRCDNVPGIQKSTDNGFSWKPVLQTDGTISVVDIKIAPTDHNIVYAATDKYIGSSLKFYRSSDAGNTWSAVNSGNLPQAETIFIDPNNYNTIYLGSIYDGLYKSKDGGVNWLPIGNGLSFNDIRTIQLDPRNTQLIYVGGGQSVVGSRGALSIGGAFRSTDNEGTSWEALSAGLANRAIADFRFDNNSTPDLIATTFNSGIWKNTVSAGVQNFGLSINNGDYATNSNQVTLNLSAPPLTTKMLLSNDGGFAGASLEDFVITKTWTLQNPGNLLVPRTVYAKFQTEGKMSGIYSDDILFDNTPPSGTATLTPPTNLIAKAFAALATGDFKMFLPIISINRDPNQKLVDLYLNATDDLSGVSKVLIENDSTDVSKATELKYSNKITWAVPFSSQGTQINIRFQDRARNNSSIYTVTAP